MRIAIPYEDGQVFQHYGKTQQFKLYDIIGGKIDASQVVPSNSSGHSALAGVLRSLGVDVVICGGIGAGAISSLKEQGIPAYGGVNGDADEVIDTLLQGKLSYNPNPSCDEHDEDECDGDCSGCLGCG